MLARNTPELPICYMSTDNFELLILLPLLLSVVLWLQVLLADHSQFMQFWGLNPGLHAY